MLELELARKIEITRSRLIIPYKEFKRLSLDNMSAIPIGSIVEGVKANELYALQTWLEPVKARRALEDFADGRCNTRPTVYPKGISGKLALVLGDGVHRSGCAYVNGIRVDVEIGLSRESLDPKKIWRLPKLVGLNPTIAKIWSDF